MSVLLDELNKCMTGLQWNPAGKLTASFCFPEDFIGFRGHFPGNPILPGICKIQAVLLMVGQWKGSTVILEEIALAKFYAPVTFGEELRIECTVVDDRERLLVKSQVLSNEKKVAELQLRVRFNNE